MRVVKIISFTVVFGLTLSSNKQPVTNLPNEVLVKKDVKPLISPLELVGKPIREVEKKLGKPSYSEKRPAEYFKEEEFRHYAVAGIYELQIDYERGKVEGIWISLDDEYQSRNPDDVLKACGFDLKISDAKLEPLGDYWWKDAADAKPFNSVHVVKFKDSGIFYQCHAFVSKSSTKR